jgi:hypothetical protein
MSKENCPDCGLPNSLHTGKDGPEGLCEIAGLRAKCADLKETIAERDKGMSAQVKQIQKLWVRISDMEDKSNKTIADMREAGIAAAEAIENLVCWAHCKADNKPCIHDCEWTPLLARLKGGDANV